MIAIVIIGWRCTPVGHEPCRQLFNRCMIRTRSGQRQPESNERSNRNFDRNQWFGGETLTHNSVLIFFVISVECPGISRASDSLLT